jgi:hypothetical protein
MSSGSYQHGSSLFTGITTSEEQDANERFQKHQRKVRTRRKEVLCWSTVAAIMLMIVLAIHVVFKHADTVKRLQHITPKGQIKWLNHLTTHIPSGTTCESTTLLMRHCEKTETAFSDDDVVDNEGDHHCSIIGYQRANYLPSLFGPNATWPTPSHLYAMSAQRPNHETYRQVETLTPLSKQIHVPINSHYQVGHAPYFADAFFRLLVSGKLCNKLTVISWKHSDIPNMAQALGCGHDEGCPEKYPHDDFDQIWVIRHAYNALSVKKAGRSLKQQNSGTWTVQGHVTKAGFTPQL